VTGPMSLSWLANTSQGRMVGDYISTSVLPPTLGGRAWPTIAVATAPSGGLFNEAMYVPTGGLPIGGGTARASAAGVVVGGPTQAAQRAPTVTRH
jgi:hypothetical protein